MMPKRPLVSEILLAAVLLTAPAAVAQPATQTAPTPGPDVLIFTNGEKLIGKLVRSMGSTVTFHSDSVGDVNVDWSKIQELHSSQNFAVVPKGTELRRHADISGIPKGAVGVADKTLTVNDKKIPVAEAALVLPQQSFENAILRSPGFFHNWGGAVTAGAALVQATQTSRSYTGGISLQRTTPTENWLQPRDRTTFNFSASDGSVHQPGQSTVKTEIFHADAERDQYLPTSHAYFFGQTSFDHNYSQGLDLQQMYGGGFGWTVVKKADETLDLKGSMSYTRQSFQQDTNNHNLVGSVFSEAFLRKLHKNMTFLQGLSYTPAWNITRAYSWNANASLTAPVFKRLGFTAAALDSFLNDPPTGFKKNSFQLTMGLTYSLK